MTTFWKSLSIASAAVGVSIAAAGVAQAAPNNTEVLDQLNSYSQEGQSSVAQVNSVFQLRDVSPSDWAFDALRNLVEKYNCIVGYPDGTFRGNRPLSRYEFAAGLNACMQQISASLLVVALTLMLLTSLVSASSFKNLKLNLQPSAHVLTTSKVA
jgi:hypothetical protein